MSYRAGIGGLSAPTIYCDSAGCETRLVIDGMPPNWFLANRAKPGWFMRRWEDDLGLVRVDVCPFHKHLKDDIWRARVAQRGLFVEVGG